MATQRPFRFGSGGYHSASRRELQAFVSKMEEAGYAIYVTPDHFGECLDVGVQLMAVAEFSSALRIGSYVFANDFRHPAVLARIAATLDALSEGRFELGIGAGYMASDYTMTGIALDAGGVRVSRLAESVSLVKRLLAGETVTMTGDYYSVRELSNFPPPVQRPHPPIFIAGGSRRVLSLAAREADSVGLIARSHGGALDMTDCSSAATLQRIEWLRAAAGERFADLELNTLVLHVAITDHRQQAADELSRTLGIPAEQLLDSIHFLIGTVEEIVETIQQWRARFGVTYIVVIREFMETLAPVVSRLAGT
jgi:probable F420-dependent oxidoreductase